MSDSENLSDESSVAEETPPGGIGTRIVLGVALGMIPFVILAVVLRGGSSDVDDLIRRLPDPAAKEKLTEMGPAVARQLIPHVYRAENPDERQLAIIGVIFSLDRQDNLPIFVRRAHWLAKLKSQSAEDRLRAIRAIRTLGGKWPIRDMVALLDDTREAVVHAAPGVIRRMRSQYSMRPGVVRDEAADMFCESFKIAIVPKGQEEPITSRVPTRDLPEEYRKLRIQKIREKIAALEARHGKPGGADEAPEAVETKGFSEG